MTLLQPTFLPSLSAHDIALLAATDTSVQTALLTLSTTTDPENPSIPFTTEPFEYWLQRADLLLAQYASTQFTSSSDLSAYYQKEGLTASTYEDHTTAQSFSDLSLFSPTASNNQVVFGAAGTDTVRGGAASDILFGAEGHNTVIAGSGQETLVSGGGGNRLEGGSGTNTFYVQNGDTVELGSVSNAIYIGPDAYGLSNCYWDSSQQGFLTLDGTTLLTPEGTNSLLVTHTNNDGSKTTFTITGVSIQSHGDGFAPTVTGPLPGLENFTMQDIAAGSNLFVYSTAHEMIGPDGSISQPGQNEILVDAGGFLRLQGVNPSDVTVSVATHQYSAPPAGFSWAGGSNTSLTGTWVTITDTRNGTSITFEDFGDPGNVIRVGGVVFGDGTEWSLSDLQNYANQETGAPNTVSNVEHVGDVTLAYATSGNASNLPMTTYSVRGQNSTVDVSTVTDTDLTIQGYQSSAYAANRLILDSISSSNAVFKQIGNDLLIIGAGSSSTVTIANYFGPQNDPAYSEPIRFSDGTLVDYAQIQSDVSQSVTITTSATNLWQQASVFREGSGRLSIGVAALDAAITNLLANNPSNATSIVGQFFSQVAQLTPIADFPDFPVLREELLAQGGALTSLVLSMGSSANLFPNSNGAFICQTGNTQSYLAGANGGTYVAPSSPDLTSYLDGGTGNDDLFGGAGPNILDGHGGSDVLTGGDGAANTYLLGSNFGQQIIVNDRADGGVVSDIIQFTNGIVQSMVSLARAGNDLLLTLKGTQNQAIVRNYFLASNGSGTTGQVSALVFADGTTLTPAAIASMNLPSVADPSQTVSAPTNDTGSTLQAWGQGSTLVAGSGNDTLRGAEGNDTLIAGTGNDSMSGGDGSNSYVFGTGFGTDVINNTSASNAVDTIVLSAANAGAVTVTQSGSDLVLTVAGQRGTITYKGFFSSSSTTSGLQSIEFADGSSWTNAQIRQEAIPRTVYNLGGTGPAFSEAFLNTGSLDVIQVAAGLSASDLSFIPTANNTLQIVVTATGQTVEVGNWFTDGTNPPVSVQFGDGSTLTWAQINALLPQSGASGNVVIHSDGTAPLVAGSGNDVLFSSTGTEKIIGGPGQDLINIMGGAHEVDIGTGATTVNLQGFPLAGQTVVYADNSGDLVYENSGGEGSGPNVLQLASDITPANVSLSLQASPSMGGPVTTADIDLTLSTGQHITLQGAMSEFANTTPALDKIQFGDGSSWSWADLLGKLESHAGVDGFAHLAADQTFALSDGSASLVAGSNSATLLSFEQNDYLFGGTGNDTLVADAGYDILQAGSGNSNLISQNSFFDNTTFTTKARASLLDGGSGQSTIDIGGGIVLADKGSSNMDLNGPSDVVLFNKGDGTDFVSSNAQQMVLSLGNGISASDITLSASGFNLNLSIDGGEIVLENYLAPWETHSSDELQVFTNTATASDATQLQSVDIKLSDIVSAFQAAQAANPQLTSWSLSNALGQLASTSNTGEAYGGDVAAYYAMNGTLQNMSLSSAQATLTDPNFGTLQQLHQSLSGGGKTLLG
jgi:Ca2+-binding RTX toxin-like protein